MYYLHIFKMYNLISFDISVNLGNHHRSTDNDHISTLLLAAATEARLTSLGQEKRL